MSKFKDGDIVRCNTSSYGCSPAYIEGETYEVRSSYDRDDEERILTVVDSNGTAFNGWLAKNFDLAAKPVEEFWHIDPDGEGMAGPFDTLEEAQKDAEKILHSSRYRVGDITIVKTVAVSSTKVSYDTTWENK